MIYMDEEQAAEFFGGAEPPANITVRPRAELDARVAAMLAATA